jgi:hypothetical protein
VLGVDCPAEYLPLAVARQRRERILSELSFARVPCLSSRTDRCDGVRTADCILFLFAESRDRGAMLLKQGYRLVTEYTKRETLQTENGERKGQVCVACERLSTIHAAHTSPASVAVAASWSQLSSLGYMYQCHIGWFWMRSALLCAPVRKAAALVHPPHGETVIPTRAIFILNTGRPSCRSYSASH